MIRTFSTSSGQNAVQPLSLPSVKIFNNQTYRQSVELTTKIKLFTHEFLRVPRPGYGFNRLTLHFLEVRMG